jgi:hypothetical protein
MIRYILNSEYARRISSLNQDDNLFHPIEYIEQSVVPSITRTFVTLSSIYLFFLIVVSRYVLEEKSSTPYRRRKFAYQMTNLITNFGLGMTGVFYECILQPFWYNVTIEQKITGFKHYILFSHVQLGFQLWALPVGLFFAGEDVTMIVHHLSVILVTSMSSFYTNGFLYWTPFFYGAIELSSVPLAIMNFFKENPEWMELYMRPYLWTRLIFAEMFLLLRVVLFIPPMLHFLFCIYIVMSTSQNVFYQRHLTAVWLSSFTLLLLQLYWGSIIAHGLIRHFRPQWLPKGKKTE